MSRIRYEKLSQPKASGKVNLGGLGGPFYRGVKGQIINHYEETTARGHQETY